MRWYMWDIGSEFFLKPSPPPSVPRHWDKVKGLLPLGVTPLRTLPSDILTSSFVSCDLIRKTRNLHYLCTLFLSLVVDVSVGAAVEVPIFFVASFVHVVLGRRVHVWPWLDVTEGHDSTGAVAHRWP